MQKDMSSDALTKSCLICYTGPWTVLCGLCYAVMSCYSCSLIDYGPSKGFSNQMAKIQQHQIIRTVFLSVCLILFLHTPSH